MNNKKTMVNRDIYLQKAGYIKPIDVEINEIIEKELNDGVKNNF